MRAHYLLLPLYVFILFIHYSSLYKNMQHGSPKAKVNRIYITNKYIEYKDKWKWENEKGKYPKIKLKLINTHNMHMILWRNVIIGH